MSKRAPIVVDIPRKHLAGLPEYIPPKLRDSTAIDYFKSLPPGSRVLHEQHVGSQIGKRMIEQVEDGPGLEFMSWLLSPSGINAFWYSAAKNAQEMRRQAKTVDLRFVDAEMRPSQYMLRQEILDSYDDAIYHADRIFKDNGNEAVIEVDHKLKFGQHVGHASLVLACLKDGDFIGYGSEALDNYNLQMMARNRGLAALEDARTLASQLGAAPSLAQLANPDSPLSVYWRNEAPKDAFQAYQSSVS